MSMQGFAPDTTIIINFDKWCPTCKWKERSSIDYPCDECIDHPVSFNSERPVFYMNEKE